MKARDHVEDNIYTDAPEDIDEAIATARPIADFLPPPEELARHIKQPVTMRIDPDVLRWFKRGGKGYQTRINAILRAYMEQYQ